jgi:hypothetical protein
MRTSLQHDTTTAAKTEWRSGQEVGNLRWAIGNRTNRLGDYLLKLGDRLCGDKPMGVVGLMDLGEEIGHRRGLREAAKA